MKTNLWGFLRLSVTALVAVASFVNAAQAAEKSKIYVNDQWVSAKPVLAGETNFLGKLFGSTTPLDLPQLAKQFLDQNFAVLGMNQDTKWAATRTQGGFELQTQRLEKTWKNLPVLGGDAVVQISGRSVVFANADSTSLDHLSLSGLIPASDAQSIAFASYQGRAHHASSPELKVLVHGQGREKTASLAYQVTVRDRNQLASDIHFIDALTGQELLVSTNVHTIAANRQVMAGVNNENDFSLDESLWSSVYNDAGCTGPASPLEFTVAPPPPRPINNDLAKPDTCTTVDPRVQTAAFAAWTNSGLVHDYYSQTHQRDSIDGAGMTLRSVVNFGGSDFVNAAWYNDRSLMLYGSGDGVNFHDFALPLDVAAHEITHGITARTSGLQYVSESGALNESFSDVFGKIIAFRNQKATDWKLGRELFVNPNLYIRDMENPEVGHTKDFKYRNEFCGRHNDFCGVHTNSGIPNRAAVILAKRVGLDKLGKIYFLALTQLLRSNSGFTETKAQTEAACSTLYGEGSEECLAVTDAFTTVGI